MMRRERALRYAVEVARRVHHVHGVLMTPLCDWEAVRFRRIWVFGSVAKGSNAPNDLDLLIDAIPCGRRTRKQAKVNERLSRRYGYTVHVNGVEEALKWLTKGMRKVSRHLASQFDEEEMPLDPKILLYPRNDLPNGGRP